MLSTASLLLNFPVPALHTWLDSYIGQSWRTMCAHIITGTFGIVSFVVLCAVSGSLAKGSHARGIPAGMLTIAAFALLNILLDGIGVTNIHQTVSTVFTVPLSGLHDGLVLALGYTELSQTIWFFGVHGPNLLHSIEETIFSPAALANAAAIADGREPVLIFTQSFFDAFSRIGESGSTLSLCLAILITSRDGGARKLCLVALLPALCNVNEPILFGIPIVLNSVYAVPFLLAPLLQILSAWAATLAGWLPITIQPVNWTMPVFLSGYVATGSNAGIIMQLFNLVLGVAVYLPFVTLSDRPQSNQSRTSMHNLALAAESTLPAMPERRLIGLSGMAGHLADTLNLELERALRNHGELFLEYQPQIDATTEMVIGVEALLRWNHPSFGSIPAPVTVALAEDGGHIGKLGILVLDKVCAERTRWQNMVHKDIVMSINVAPRQFMTPGFAQDVLNCVERHGLIPQQIELEITESTVLASVQRYP